MKKSVIYCLIFSLTWNNLAFATHEIIELDFKDSQTPQRLHVIPRHSYTKDISHIELDLQQQQVTVHRQGQKADKTDDLQEILPHSESVLLSLPFGSKATSPVIIAKHDIINLPWDLEPEKLTLFILNHTAWLTPLGEDDYKLEFKGSLLGGMKRYQPTGIYNGEPYINIHPDRPKGGSGVSFGGISFQESSKIMQLSNQQTDFFKKSSQQYKDSFNEMQKSLSNSGSNTGIPFKIQQPHLKPDFTLPNSGDGYNHVLAKKMRDEENRRKAEEENKILDHYVGLLRKNHPDFEQWYKPGAWEYTVVNNRNVSAILPEIPKYEAKLRDKRDKEEWSRWENNISGLEANLAELNKEPTRWKDYISYRTEILRKLQEPAWRSLYEAVNANPTYGKNYAPNLEFFKGYNKGNLAQAKKDWGWAEEQFKAEQEAWDSLYISVKSNPTYGFTYAPDLEFFKNYSKGSLEKAKETWGWAEEQLKADFEDQVVKEWGDKEEFKTEKIIQIAFKNNPNDPLNLMGTEGAMGVFGGGGGLKLNKNPQYTILRENRWLVPTKDLQKIPKELGKPRLTKDGKGLRWGDEANSIRIMKGDKTKDHPTQRIDYVTVTRNGEKIGRDRKAVTPNMQYPKPSKNPDTHIPYDEWVKWEKGLGE